MSFMEPRLIKTAYWEVETNEGSVALPIDVVDCDDWKGDSDIPVERLEEIFGDYVSGQIEYAERYTIGYLWRLSANGYQDCTDWSAFDSPKQAYDDCMEMYGDSMDDGDLEMMAEWIK